MANGRMIQKKISLCEQLADCSLLARILYTWGIAHTSDWGVIAASPRRLKAEVMPLASETFEEIAIATEELVTCGLWIRMQADGSEWVYYPNFDEYQKIDYRCFNSRDGVPLPPDHGPERLRRNQRKDAPKDAEVTPKRAEASGSEQKRAEASGSEQKRAEVTLEEKLIEVNRSEEKLSEENAPALPPVADTPANQYAHMGKSYSDIYQTARNYWRDNGDPPQGIDTWCSKLMIQCRNAALLELLGGEQAVIDAFTSSPPIPGDWPDKWLNGLAEVRRREARAAPRRLMSTPTDASKFRSGSEEDAA